LIIFLDSWKDKSIELYMYGSFSSSLGYTFFPKYSLVLELKIVCPPFVAPPPLPAAEVSVMCFFGYIAA